MDASVYIQIARRAIQEHFDDIPVNKSAYMSAYPELSLKKASFVTLTLEKQLRGCIGSIIAHRPLIDDLISNARSAAFHDPRFSPLNKDEFSKISIEVSILTDPHEVEYQNRIDLAQIIRPGIDGVILRLGNYQATFLPQVWEELTDFESFFTHLGVKAGLGSDPLAYHPDIYTYQVQKYKEGSDEF